MPPQHHRIAVPKANAPAQAPARQALRCKSYAKTQQPLLLTNLILQKQKPPSRAK